MPWTTTYLFFLLIVIINKLLYEASLRKPVLSFVLISFLFATYFFLISIGDNTDIIEQFVIYRDVSIGQHEFHSLDFDIRFIRNQLSAISLV